MATIKEAALKMINRLLDDCTVEDFIYEINVIAQIFDGLHDAQEGKTISNKELVTRLIKKSRSSKVD